MASTSKNMFIYSRFLPWLVAKSYLIFSKRAFLLIAVNACHQAEID